MIRNVQIVRLNPKLGKHHKQQNDSLRRQMDEILVFYLIKCGFGTCETVISQGFAAASLHKLLDLDLPERKNFWVSGDTL